MLPEAEAPAAMVRAWVAGGLNVAEALAPTKITSSENAVPVGGFASSGRLPLPGRAGCGASRSRSTRCARRATGGSGISPI